MWWRSLIFMGAFFGALLAAVPNVLWLVGALAGKVFSYRLPYAPFGWTAAGLVLLLWGCLAYGHFVGRFRAEVKQVEYSSPEVPPSFDGYRIVQISDLHVDSFQRPEALRRVTDLANAQGADIILFTGDVVTGAMEGILPHEAALHSLHAPDGVLSVLGNHDFFIYDRDLHSDAQRSAMADRLASYERDTLGWNVLRNASCIIRRGADSIAVAGVDNINGNQGFRTIQKGDLAAAMRSLDGVFTVLMSHDPGHWRAEVLPKSHAQITLSGHTHAAQVRLLGWSPANLMFDECDGRYDEDGRMLYVNAGTGCTAPVRIGCPSEVTVITLRHI